MWSDPEEIPGWAVSPRGAGYLFGYDATNEVRVLLIRDDDCAGDVADVSGDALCGQLSVRIIHSIPFHCVTDMHTCFFLFISSITTTDWS
jgi:hypothetical protein